MSPYFIKEIKVFNYLANKIFHRKKKKNHAAHATGRQHDWALKSKYNVEAVVFTLFVLWNVICLAKLPIGYSRKDVTFFTFYLGILFMFCLLPWFITCSPLPSILPICRHWFPSGTVVLGKEHGLWSQATPKFKPSGFITKSAIFTLGNWL